MIAKLKKLFGFEIPKSIEDQMKENPEQVIWNGRAPYCPFCKKNTEMTMGSSSSTLAYYPPRYVNGKNMNPDKNRTSTNWRCATCNTNFETYGNAFSGHVYKY